MKRCKQIIATVHLQPLLTNWTTRFAKKVSKMFLYLLSWVASLIHIFLCTLSLAAGLYYIAEVVEEYTVLTAKIIRYMIYITSLVYIGMYLFEGMPARMIVTGLLTNLDYFILLSTFPSISLSSVSFIVGVVLVLANHYFAFHFFTTVYYPFPEILAYFTICLWLVPFSFFVSLSINDYTLPTIQTTNYATFGSPMDNVFRRPKRAGILGIFDYISEKKDNWKEELFGRNKMF